MLKSEGPVRPRPGSWPLTVSGKEGEWPASGQGHRWKRPPISHAAGREGRRVLESFQEKPYEVRGDSVQKDTPWKGDTCSA